MALRMERPLGALLWAGPCQLSCGWALWGGGEGGMVVGGGTRSEKADLSPQQASGWGWSRHCVFPAGLQLPFVLSYSVQIPVLL